LKLSKPDIGLFCCGRIENPFTVWSNQFFKPCRIAIYLAKNIAHCVLAFEVKNIDRKSDVVKIVVFDSRKMLEKLTIIVIENVGWNGTWIVGWEGGFQKRL
jgi:hypothetical protein